ncbi:MAG: hypothetical protein IVW51_11930 [Thermaceae bacterium]|nr:hypothetical protein [Thermaceae bacterium]
MRILWAGALVLTLLSCGNTSTSNPSACTQIQMVSVAVGFSPTPITVQKGGCVIFKNADPAITHSVGNDPAKTSVQTISVSLLAPGYSSTQITLNLAGEIDYMCTIHNSMKGVINVQ